MKNLLPLAALALPTIVFGRGHAFDTLGDLPGVFFNNPEPTPTPTPTPAPAPAPTPTPSPSDDLAALRQQLADQATKLKAFEDAEEARKKQGMSDVEKAQADAKKAAEESAAHAARVAALEQELAKSSAITALTAKNVIDPELAYLAIRDKIEIKDGKATNIEALVEELLKTKPHLIATGRTVLPDTRRTNPPAPTDKPGDLRTALAKKYAA